MELTIITPTYNRSKNLITLYDSLVAQSCKDFKWLIIDDGSNDDTEATVQSFINANRLQIEYHKKANGGKHTALNFGIKLIDTELTFIVDSDDWLTESAVELILATKSKYAGENDICGFSFLRQYPNGKINGKQFKFDFIDTYINARINQKDMQADKAEVWFTRCLKEFPFPEFDGERFLGEDSVWIPMALKYQMVFVNKAIYVSSYLDDGLTNNRRRNNIKSPNGCFYRAKVTIDASKKTKIDTLFLIKCVLQYQIYARFANMSKTKVFKDCKRKLSFLALSPFSYIIYKKWSKDYKEQ